MKQLCGRLYLLAGIALTTVAVAPLAAQQVDDSAKAALQLRLDALDQQTRILARKFELYQDSVAAAAKGKPSVVAGPGGFQLKSADGNFVLRLRGYLQADGRFFPERHGEGAYQRLPAAPGPATHRGHDLQVLRLPDPPGLRRQRAHHL